MSRSVGKLEDKKGPVLKFMLSCKEGLRVVLICRSPLGTIDFIWTILKWSEQILIRVLKVE